MHYSLVAHRVEIRISLEIQHQHFYQIPVPRSRRQMDRLTPHMAIPMLGHIKFCFFILCELVSHELQDLRRLFKHHELEYVHVVV